jgi:hypothetical protein
LLKHVDSDGDPSLLVAAVAASSLMSVETRGFRVQPAATVLLQRQRAPGTDDLFSDDVAFRSQIISKAMLPTDRRIAAMRASGIAAT